MIAGIPISRSPSSNNNGVHHYPSTEQSTTLKKPSLDLLPRSRMYCTINVYLPKPYQLKFQHAKHTISIISSIQIEHLQAKPSTPERTGFP